MSDIIEERLEERFCNMIINVEKQSNQKSYLIRVIFDWKKGFQFIYSWQDKLTVDSNVDEITTLIYELILKYFKKVRT